MNILCWEGYNQKKFLKNFPYPIKAQSFISDFQIAQDLKKKIIKSDIININNPFIRDYLWKYNFIKEIEFLKYSEHYSSYLNGFSYLSKWTKSQDKKKVIGIGQRFGNLNFVINSKSIKKNTSELEGYSLINETNIKYGILLFEDFNIMQILLSSGINPFKKLNKQQIIKFSNTCSLWFERAKLISDNYLTLNKLLVKKKIHLYLTGGTYTCSVARKEGNDEIMSIIPKNRINNLKQGIIFTEITSILKAKNKKDYLAEECFLDFILSKKKSYEISMSKYTCNPILQMGNKNIFDLFSVKDLSIIQFENLYDSKVYSHEYQIMPDYLKLLKIFKKTLSLFRHKFV